MCRLEARVFALVDPRRSLQLDVAACSFERASFAVGLLAAVALLFVGVVRERKCFVTIFGIYLVGSKLRVVDQPAALALYRIISDHNQRFRDLQYDNILYGRS